MRKSRANDPGLPDSLHRCERKGSLRCDEALEDFGFALMMLFLAFAAHAQGTSSGDPATRITLGQSIVPLTGPWKFHVGDDPRWADPHFDDSQWETVDLLLET